MKKHKSYGYVLAALGMTVLALIFAVSAVLLFGSGYVQSVKDGGKDMIARTLYVLHSDDNGEDIARKVDMGLMSVGDYIVSSMTGSEYLLDSKTDDDFARDIVYIVYGSDEPEKVAQVRDDLVFYSRKYVLNELLTAEDPEYGLTIPLPDNKGSRISDCQITKPLRGDNGYTIGIRQVEGSFNVVGDDVRTDFYVDGILYRATLKQDDDDSRNFKVSWDTSGVTEGEHDVRILLRSSDGRGFVADGGEVLIPHCMEIVDGGVSNGSVLEGQNDSWYALAVEDADCYVNFVDLSGDIAVSLYDIYGNVIGRNDLPDSEFEVLRGHKQDIPAIEESTGIDGLRSIYYVLVSRSPNEESTDELTYKMIQTPNVAKFDGQYYAVKNNAMALPTPVPVYGNENDIAQQEITLVDLSGNETVKVIDEVSMLPINGFLETMTINEFGKEEELNIFPSFDNRELYYGYVTNGNAGSVVINAESLEGYAATISMTNESGLSTAAVEPGQSIVLVPGANEININVDSFSGITKTYKIYILNGEDKDGFTKTVMNKFPSSYDNGLWLLHSMHPDYVFKPYNTGLDFADVMSHEDNRDRNLASDYSHPGWVVESSPVYDGGGWRQAKTEVVRYFIDPRNFLDPRSVFQFELLSFDPSAQTIEGVRNMIKGSFMDTDDPDYASIIYEAGKTANVSPYFLASRILQEMGYSGQSLLCHGTLPDYEGYYNFYNIGSTPDPSIENGALINGAKYAMWGKDPDGKKITDEEKELLLPWDTVDKAITGGALWMASRYTAAGQDTLYFQKFDVIDNEDGLYEHQYAQNVSMAYTEGRRYFDSYASIGMIDQPFVFLIPVYSNLPSSFGTMPEA